MGVARYSRNYSGCLAIWTHLASIETCFSYFLSMCEAKTREYFEGVCNHFHAPATDIPEMVIGMELITICSIPETGANKKFVLGHP